MDGPTNGEKWNGLIENTHKNLRKQSIEFIHAKNGFRRISCGINDEIPKFIE